MCGLQFGAFGGALHRASLTFVSQVAHDAEVAARYGLQKTVVPVRGIRALRKRDMVHNDYVPNMEIDPETYEVRADGMLLTCDAAQVLPMAQRYFLF